MRTRMPIKRDQDTTITDEQLEQILTTCRNEIRKVTGSEGWPEFLIVPSPAWARRTKQSAERLGMTIILEENTDPGTCLEISEEST